MPVYAITDEARKMMSMCQYLRDENGRPFGCLVAVGNSEQVVVGMSLCSKKDIFHKKIGREIAMARANKSSKITIPISNIDCVSYIITTDRKNIPYALNQVYDFFYHCQRRFKIHDQSCIRLVI